MTQDEQIKEGVRKWMTESRPTVAWPRFFEAVRKANWSLQFGSIVGAEDDEHYVWGSWSEAIEYIRGICDEVPTLYYDTESGIVSEYDPTDDPNNWDRYINTETDEEDAVWIGGEWMAVNFNDVVIPKDLREYL